VGEILVDRLAAGRCTVGVIGLGQTGLPLALAFAGAGIPTAGYDIDPGRVAALHQHSSYISDIPDSQIRAVAGNLQVDTDAAVLGTADVFVICVPTPASDDGEADLRYVDAAIGTVGTHLRENALLVMQSTVPPGTTSAAATRLSRLTGLVAGRQFHVAAAPERINPAGRGQWSLSNTPKLVGGLTPECTRCAELLFSKIVSTVVPVPNPEVAEIAKVFENTFRMVNIALTYELADVCHLMGVSARDVIGAAATKPYGFLPHWPGPGVGGECIPVDPLFLKATAARDGISTPLLETAYRHVRRRPSLVVDRLAERLYAEGGDLAGSRVLVVGVSYKPGVADTRNSPALEIIRELRLRAAKPRYTDPYVPELSVDGEPVERVEWDRASVADHDCVVLVTPHDQVMRRPLWYAAPLVLDTWQLLPSGDGVHHL